MISKTRKIFKYKLEKRTTVTVEMPEDADIISCVMQDDDIVVYAIVDENSRSAELRTFHVIGTGQFLPTDCTIINHLATLENAPFMWHVFEIK